MRHSAKRLKPIYHNLQSSFQSKNELMKVLCKVFIIAICFATTLNAQSGVYVNQWEIPYTHVQQLEQYYQLDIQPGRYWYDAKCGLWGMEGGPALGIMLSNLNLGGPLRTDASRGRTGIFINGRQINSTERAQWQQLTGPITPGYYWLDAYGNVGYAEGGAITNLLQLARQQSSGSNSFYRNFYTGTGSGGNSDGFYIMGKDWSYSKF